MARLSPVAEAADRALRDREGTSLAVWLTGQQSKGASYRVMASRLHLATGGVVIPSHETIRRWIDQLDLTDDAGDGAPA